MTTATFQDLGLSAATLKALSVKGFEIPTPIQAMTIPALLENSRDIVAQAQTGTGKTAAFGLPLIELLSPDENRVKALILVPTRELAMQVTEEIMSLRGSSKLQIAAVYGGQSYTEQLRRLRRGVDVVVGTPGRIQDHIDRGTLVLNSLDFLILDEADEMLNMGFLEDIEKILESTPSNKRMLLFSATMPYRILEIARRFMSTYEIMKVDTPQLSVKLTEQIYFEVAVNDRLEALCRIIDREEDFYGIVFCRTRIETDQMADKLIARGYDAQALHGDITQAGREQIIRKFKKHTINILVATDVAARGIDISDLTHVINLSLPQDPESYVHRIGRTGRAGKKGTAITFISPSEYRKLLRIEKFAGSPIRKEKIPALKEIISLKKERLTNMIRSAVDDLPETPSRRSGFYALAEELADEISAEKIISVLLQLAFPGALDESSYPDIQDVSIDKKGKTRLFFSVGKKDNFLPGTLVELIKKKTGLPDHLIEEVRVMDSFSFVTVPFDKAEEVIRKVSFTGEQGIEDRKGREKRPRVNVEIAGPGESSGRKRYSDKSAHRFQKGFQGGKGKRSKVKKPNYRNKSH